MHYQTTVACQILLKALTNMPHTDFTLCKCLIDAVRVSKTTATERLSKKMYYQSMFCFLEKISTRIFISLNKFLMLHFISALHFCFS